MSDQDGFTLIELVVAMVLGVAVLGLAGNLLIASVTQQRKIDDRIDNTARARIAVDSMLRDVQGQSCGPTGAGGADGATGLPAQPNGVSQNFPIISADGNSVTFTTDRGDGNNGYPVSVERLAFNPTARTITRTLWDPKGTYAYPGTARSSSILLTGAFTGPATGVADANGDRDSPMFQYFGTRPGDTTVPPVLTRYPAVVGTAQLPASARVSYASPDDRPNLVRLQIVLGSTQANVAAPTGPVLPLVRDSTFFGTYSPLDSPDAVPDSAC